MPMGYTRSIPDCYPKEIELRDRLFFGNPSVVTTCQNECSGGLDGPPCTFDREKDDGFRKQDLETKDKVGTNEHLTLAYYPRCSFTTDEIEKWPELKAHIERESSLATCADRISCYIEVERCPWEGKNRFIGEFFCLGQEGVIQCRSKQFGAGLEKGNENIACPGYYGARVVFGDNEEQADGSFKRKERAWEPGEVDPAPDSAPSSPPNPLAYESSSDGLPSGSDQGHERGDWSSSS